MSVVLRTFRIGGAIAATGRTGLAAKAATEVLAGRAEQMLAEYIESADVEAFEGRGDATLTKDIKRAKRFETQAEAFEFWRQQSKTRPLRGDGEPNRPLTAFNVTFETIED